MNILNQEFYLQIQNNLNKQKMSKTHTHNSIQARCTMDEPIQLLIDKLSTKSTDLYVFWQNYNQMYRQYNQKINENNKLKQQIQYLKRVNINNNQPKQTQVRIQEDPYLKDRLKNAQINCQGLRAQLQKNKNINRDLKVQTSRLMEQINQMQLLISQLREENSQQRLSITNILQKLKVAQSQISNYQKIYQQVQEKDAIIARLIQKQKQLNNILEDRDDQIQKLNKDFKDTRNKYQRIIKQSMQNAKQTIMDTIPPNLLIRKSIKQ